MSNTLFNRKEDNLNGSDNFDDSDNVDESDNSSVSSDTSEESVAPERILHETLKTDMFYTDEFDNFWVGYDIYAEVPKIKTCLKSDPSIVYEKLIDIWQPGKRCDYWMRNRSLNNDYIILQDYSGIKIYDSTLNIIFQLDIEQEKRYDDVFGCEVIDGKLVVWNPDDDIIAEASERNDLFDPYINISGFDDYVNKIKHFVYDLPV